jgi:glyoxylase I family protein
MTHDFYRSYLIRSWQESGADVLEARWHGEVESVQTGQKWRFHSPPSMLKFIHTQLEALTSDNFIKERQMTTESIATAGVHHITLTVSDVNRSRQFYTDLLGFNFVTDFGPRALLHNGSVLLALTPPPDPAQAIPADQFNENRIGLDHLSLNVGGMADLEAAAALLAARGITCGEIKPLEPFDIAVLAFRDPDNIQVELTAPLG